MIEWIKREDRKPPKGVVVIHTDGWNFWTVQDIGHNEWTHWMPLPAPPPRTIMVEISEEDVRNIVLCGGNGWQTGSPWRGVVRACVKALEAKR